MAVQPSHALPGGPVLGDAQFEFICREVERNAGIVLGPNKRQLVQGRLARRLRVLGLPDYQAYCNYLVDSGGQERDGLINAITTNVTGFFREQHHFDALNDCMLAQAMQRNAAMRRLRLWSAGCSSGEEPYSMAMVSRRVVARAGRWDLKILATDIDSEMVATAEAGMYGIERLEGMSENWRQEGFRRGTAQYEGMVRVRPELRAMVTARVLNLLHDWPMRGPFDVIFCRNVMIYFDQVTRERLVRRFASILAPRGYLCIGHSESILPGAAPLKLVGRTIYRREH